MGKLQKICETSLICITTFSIFTEYGTTTQHFESKLLSSSDGWFYLKTTAVCFRNVVLCCVVLCCVLYTHRRCK